MVDDLIFDIGCNNGDDTDFYLRKGFRVVALDADKDLCDEVSSRFAKEIGEGRCEVVHGAVSETGGGSLTFYICEEGTDWNSCAPYFVERAQKEGYAYRKVDVPTVSVGDLLDAHGAPYYMKIDIEGADRIPLQALIGRKDLPPYVSIEVAQHDLREGLEQLLLLDQLGYKEFNFFNQGLREQIKAPNPPREGKYAVFDGAAVTTGLFGKELGGNWLKLPAAVARLTGIHDRYILFRENKAYSKRGVFGGTLLSKVHNRIRRHVLHDPVAWYELHARLPTGVGGQV